MRQAESAAQIVQLSASFFGRGTVTNCFLGKDELARECAARTLFFDEAPGALLLYRRRGAFYRMNFYLREDAPLPLLPDEHIVTEIAFRERDTALREAAARWQQAGMTPVLTRHRMKRNADAPRQVLLPDGMTVETAAARDLDAATVLLTENFSALTGCLPTNAELFCDIERGGVLLARENGETVGLLRMQADRAAAEIRQLAVAERFRGKGAASALLQAALTKPDLRVWRVWVVRGNHSAARVYEKQDFTDDGFSSVVLATR